MAKRAICWVEMLRSFGQDCILFVPFAVLFPFRKQSMSFKVYITRDFFHQRRQVVFTVSLISTPQKLMGQTSLRTIGLTRMLGIGLELVACNGDLVRGNIIRKEIYAFCI